MTCGCVICKVVSCSQGVWFTTFFFYKFFFKMICLQSGVFGEECFYRGFFHGRVYVYIKKELIRSHFLPRFCVYKDLLFTLGFHCFCKFFFNKDVLQGFVSKVFQSF